MSNFQKHTISILLICALCIASAFAIDRQAAEVSFFSEPSRTIVIDAGHGGEDGGAISCTGAQESRINLEISLRLNDFCHLLGRPTIMLRSTDISLHDAGTEGISHKKVSDLKNRVKRIQSTPNALVLSIHQNHFSESQYAGAQVFYAQTDGSQTLAEQMQENLRIAVSPTNHRVSKPAQKVYLMQKITCTGVLVECGFLSNPEEEALLRDGEYQKRLAAVIGCSVCSFIAEENKNEV